MNSIFRRSNLPISIGQSDMQRNRNRNTGICFSGIIRIVSASSISRYGRAFCDQPIWCWSSRSSKIKDKGIPRGLDEIDMALKVRLTDNTGRIRTAIAKALQTGTLNDARQMVLNFYWLKLGAHELLFDRTQFEYDEYGIH